MISPKRLWLTAATAIVLALTVLVLAAVFGKAACPATSGSFETSASLGDSLARMGVCNEMMDSLTSADSSFTAMSGVFVSCETSPELLDSCVSGSLQSDSVDSGSLRSGSFESQSLDNSDSLDVESMESRSLNSQSCGGESLDCGCDEESLDSTQASGQDSLMIGQCFEESFGDSVDEVGNSSTEMGTCVLGAGETVIDGVGDIGEELFELMIDIPDFIVQAIGPLPGKIGTSLFNFVSDAFTQLFEAL